MKNTARLLALILIASTAIPAAWAQPAGGPPGGMPGMGASGPTEVGVITMQPETAPITTVLPGRIVASATANVRPQVEGVVTEVLVREGQPIEAGDVIAKIDPATYEADVAVAEASLASAQASVPSAQAQVDRYETLVASGGISQSELDTTRVELAQAQASVASAQAQLTVANLTLKRSTITAPISGIVGAVNVEVGSLLTANQADSLTTIRQVDPVDITLTESSSNLLTSRRNMQGDPPNPQDTAAPPEVTVTLTLEDGSSYDQEGSIASMDLVVSETTGTFTLRGSMPNPDRILLPGMFVRATIAFGQQDGVFLVPQRAVTFNADGTPQAYFVGADNKVEQRELTAERVVNNAWVVTSGVAAGDQLIVDGLQKIQAGTEVKPLEVEMDADGVVHQEVKSMPAGGAMPEGGAMPAGGATEGAAPAGAAPTDGTTTTTEAPADGAAPADGTTGSAPAAQGSN